MNKQEVRALIEDVGIVPALRLSSASDVLFVVEAIAQGGIPIVEVTMTVPGAIDVVKALARTRPGVVVGAGTVLDLETAHGCIEAGAMFLTSTGFDAHVVEFAARSNVVVFPGALTPTEVITAWKAGADFVKVYPCAAMGGPSYIRALKAPFPKIPLIASGGVNQQTATEFIHAGATALGVGSALIPREAVRRRQTDWILELARRFTGMVRQGRPPAVTSKV